MDAAGLVAMPTGSTLLFSHNALSIYLQVLETYSCRRVTLCPGGMFLSHRYQRQHKRRGEIRELPLRKRNNPQRRAGEGGKRAVGAVLAIG
jgi:hypothetical protein